jgi:hypothetical protein
MLYGGAQWKVNNNVMLQGAYNRADNLLDMGWVDLDMVHRFDKDRYVRLDVQYIHQAANGSKNLGDFSMDNKAAYLEARWVAVVDTVWRLRWNSDGDELRSIRSAWGRRTWCSASVRTRKQASRTIILGSTSTSRHSAPAASPST